MKKKFVFREMQISKNQITGKTEIKIFKDDRIWPFGHYDPAIGSSFVCLDGVQWVITSKHLERLKDDPSFDMVVVILAQVPAVETSIV